MSCERRLRYFPLYSSTWLIFEVFDFSFFKCKLWTFWHMMNECDSNCGFCLRRSELWTDSPMSEKRVEWAAAHVSLSSVFLDSVCTLILCSYDAIVPLPKHQYLFYAFQIHYTLIMPTMFWLIVVRFLHTHTHTRYSPSFLFIWVFSLSCWFCSMHLHLHLTRCMSRLIVSRSIMLLRAYPQPCHLIHCGYYGLAMLLHWRWPMFIINFFFACEHGRSIHFKCISTPQWSHTHLSLLPFFHVCVRLGACCVPRVCVWMSKPFKYDHH